MLINNKKTRNCTFPRGWLHFFILLVLIIGVFFRFVNLDKKIYYFDETMTVIRISNLNKYLENFKDQIIYNGDLQNYLHLHAIKSVSTNDVIKNLFVVPQHTPLYFVMLRFWAEWFGSSVAVIRSMSAFISLLSLPCVYWLCLELFQSSLVGWVAAALIAISPIQVLYAQEARMYSLHTVIILLSSATLLRAMRLKTKLSWTLYLATLVLGLYTHSLYILVVIGHSIYVLITEGFRLSKVVIVYLFILLLGLLAFVPWLFVIFTHFEQAHSSLDWMTSNVSRSALVKYWGINLSRLFLDLTPTYSLNTNFSSFNNSLLLFVIALILSIVTYSFYFLYCHTPKRIWLFCLTLSGVTAITLVLQDLILGGYRSYHIRYLIASYLGIYLTIAYLFATKIAFPDNKVWQQKLWQVMLIFLISCGIISNTVSSQAQVWWNKYFSCEIAPIAKTINQANDPIVIIDYNWWSMYNFLSLSNLLEPKVRIQLLTQANLMKIPEGFSNVFLFTPSDKLQNKLAKEQKFKLESVYQQQMSLWKLEK